VCGVEEAELVGRSGALEGRKARGPGVEVEAEEASAAHLVLDGEDEAASLWEHDGGLDAGGVAQEELVELVLLPGEVLYGLKEGVVAVREGDGAEREAEVAALAADAGEPDAEGAVGVAVVEEVREPELLKGELFGGEGAERGEACAGAVVREEDDLEGGASGLRAGVVPGEGDLGAVEDGPDAELGSFDVDAVDGAVDAALVELGGVEAVDALVEGVAEGLEGEEGDAARDVGAGVAGGDGEGVEGGDVAEGGGGDVYVFEEEVLLSA
jgi:hypothetical protein